MCIRDRVLIVDDDLFVTKMIKDILETAGFEVTILNDPRLAVSVAQELDPDIILVDRVMPYLDGCDLCRELSRNHFTSHIPILMLTSRADTVDRIAGLEAGADDYLCKPFDELELIARIRALIPVSYTHLQEILRLGRELDEVKKRNKEYQHINENLEMELDMLNTTNISLQKKIEKITLQNSILAVSYTHLDVYKRQIPG